MKQTEQDIERVNLYLPKELVEKVRIEAKKNFRNLSGQVGFILEQFFRADPSHQSNC